MNGWIPAAPVQLKPRSAAQRPGRGFWHLLPRIHPPFSGPVYLENDGDGGLQRPGGELTNG